MLTIPQQVQQPVQQVHPVGCVTFPTPVNVPAIWQPIQLQSFCTPVAPIRGQAPPFNPRPGSAEDPEPWLDAASTFDLNTDFDIAQTLSNHCMGIMELIEIMKVKSFNKCTIQALGDKIALSRMLDNMNVPQMPLLFATQRQVDRRMVYDLVNDLEYSTDANVFDIVVKPTHMSNGLGTVIFDKDRWDNEEGGWNREKLFMHMQKYLAQRADTESEALKSVIPGFIVQSRYRSVLDFKTPLEVRVVTLWGKTRMGIWWWGRGTREEKRNTWIVRRPHIPGRLGEDDAWEAIHEHAGDNPGFHKALELFRKAMPAMSAAAEAIATAVGAPFLRSDFFVGSEEWGVRLNEVAYGSGTEYRQLPEGMVSLVDDGPIIAKILQEGFRRCRMRHTPEHFLSRLGATGGTYESLKVRKLPRWSVMQPVKLELPEEAATRLEELETEDLPSPMPNALCETRCGFERPPMGFSFWPACQTQMPMAPTPAPPMPQPAPMGLGKGVPPRAMSWAPPPQMVPRPSSRAQPHGCDVAKGAHRMVPTPMVRGKLTQVNWHAAPMRIV